MKRNLLIIICFILVSFSHLLAQPYGNEWLTYGVPYYKIQVATDGIYRVPYTTLNNAIPNFGSINPNSLVLFHNGKQVPIFVSTSNSSFSSSDYIEFYGKHNIGDVDSVLYANDSLQPDIYYSLFNDTSIYYLASIPITSGPHIFYSANPNDLTNPPPAESYFIFPSRQVYTGQNIQGIQYYASGEQAFKSTFDYGEGYGDVNFFGNFSNSGQTNNQVTNQTFNIPTPSIVNTGPAATFKCVYENYSPEPHTVNVQLNGLSPIVQSSYGFQLNRYNISIPAGQLPNGGSTVTYSAQDQATSSQQNVVFLNEIDYPRAFDFGGANSFFFTINSNNAKQLLSITSFNSNGLQPVLFDITDGIVIQSTQAPGSTPLQFVLPATSATSRDLCLISTDPSSFNTVTQMAPVVFKNYTNLNANYLMIYNTLLDSNSDVTNYNSYRSNNGTPYIGKYYTAMVDIDQLYDQFAYGVRKSPLAIRNFVQYCIHRYSTGAWTQWPQYVFLVGKGREYPDMRNGGSAYTQCYVPCFGQPGSDNLLAATRSSDTATVSIGRLAAQTDQQVHDYLAKIQAYESYQDTTSTGNGSSTGYPADEAIAPKLWQKQILHFSGGTGAAEQSLFQYYLQSYGQIAADTSWGTNITSYQKTSSAPIATSEAQVIQNQIDSGVSLLTFFGHSATAAFDFSIDEPEAYTNINRYPVILSNGCFAGDIDEATPGYSERFVLAANKGAIAFMATTSISVSNSLSNFSYELYQNFCRPYYLNSFGNCVRQTLKYIYTNYSTDPFSLMACYEFTLHGDPALRLNQYERPDYAIDNTSVYFTPSTVTQSNNTFQVNIICTNLGKAIKDSMNVSLKRVVYDVNNNPITFNYVQRIKAPYYKDTITFTLPTVLSNVGTGQNLFYPYVDASFEIAEMAENNNGLNLNPKPLFIQQDDVLPIYPYEYAIDSSAAVVLKASTTNPFATLRAYDFEIDTTQLFNSPLGVGLHQKGKVTQIGGVLHWSPPGEIYKDSLVYYWRVKIDTSANNWHYTSFEHIKGQYGWNQSHFFQFRQDNFQTLILDSLSRSFRFDSTKNNITVLTGFANAEGGNLDYSTMGWNYNNSNEYRFRMGGCGFNEGVTFAVIDGTTGLPWVSYNGGGNFGSVYGNWHCSSEADPQYGFDFSTGNEYGYNWPQLIQKFIDSIPIGDYVLIYSDNVVPYSTWSPALITAFSQLGFNAQALKTSSTPGPFVFFTKRTANNSYQSVFATSSSFYTPVDTSVTFNGNWYQGQMLSPLIGPAKSWNDMQWRGHSLESPGTDIDSVDIFGVNYNGLTRLIRTTAAYNNPITNISATQYPYLQLRLRTADNINFKPVQLNYWRVLYQEVPEAAVNPAAHYVLTSDTVSQGGSLHVEVGIENVSYVGMDSLLTYFTITDAQSHTTIDSANYAPLPALTVHNIIYNKPITSTSTVGLDHLTIEVNPHNKQPEEYHFNNYAQLNFYGKSNNTNPLLDVTFDGAHIFNGDIISAKPDIVINLRSLNKYLLLNDSTDLNVFVLYPGQTTPVRINYDGQILKFVPADTSAQSKTNQAEALYNPNFTQDGTYELMVQDMDPSGNHSSNVSRYEGNTFFDYKMTFQVINKPSITNVLNYPNPFSTSTKFVFTLTGSEIPQYMTIQIMTVKGIVVKEITEQELGPVHIGTNISQYAWDGRDTYGSLLANGVYFYRVVTKLNTQNLDGMSMSYDKYFKKGFGKLVILR
jgi:hypothetical protein